MIKAKKHWFFTNFNLVFGIAQEFQRWGTYLIQCWSPPERRQPLPKHRPGWTSLFSWLNSIDTLQMHRAAYIPDIDFITLLVLHSQLFVFILRGDSHLTMCFSEGGEVRYYKLYFWERGSVPDSEIFRNRSRLVLSCDERRLIVKSSIRFFKTERDKYPSMVPFLGLHRLKAHVGLPFARIVVHYSITCRSSEISRRKKKRSKNLE